MIIYNQVLLYEHYEIKIIYLPIYGSVSNNVVASLYSNGFRCQIKDQKRIMSQVIVHTSRDKGNDPWFANLSHWTVTYKAPAAFDI